MFARKHCDAVYGQGVGMQGNSYAIPTKGSSLKTLPLENIHWYVLEFLACAKEFKHTTFFVTRIGCGLAGYKDEDVAPMFRGATSNCIFPIEWKQYLEEDE